MLVERDKGGAIRAGRVTVLLRRWRRPLARPGSVHRTAVGRLAVDVVEQVDPERLSEADLRAGGYRDAASALADLRGEPGWPVYLLRIRYLDEQDPRTLLAGDDGLTEEQVAALDRRLDRMDAGVSGAWTAATLALIAVRPGVRAGDLAEELGRERLPFKADVRRLKALGLTLSLEVGYRLSPRGAAYLARTRRTGGERSQT